MHVLYDTFSLAIVFKLNQVLPFREADPWICCPEAACHTLSNDSPTFTMTHTLHLQNKRRRKGPLLALPHTKHSTIYTESGLVTSKIV